MAYIGKKPSTQFGALAYYDTFTGDGSTTTFDVTEAMPNGGDNDVTVVVDNVRQEPGATKSYTIGADGNGDIKRVTFNVAPDDGSEIYVINPGRQSSILEVSDNTVSTAKLQATSVTTAKIAADAVTGAKIADDAVDSEHLVDGSVDNVHLAGSIANDKLANSSITINGTAVSLGGTVTAGTDWQAVVVADGSTQLTAVAGKGYFLDTNTGVIEVLLPTSPSRGDTIILADYGGNFATNNVIVNAGSNLIDSVETAGLSQGYTLSTNNLVVELVFVDTNKGWQILENEAKSSLTATEDTNQTFIEATGGTVTTSGDFKIHTFTGDGCFVVSTAPGGSAPGVDYLVVAGGGGGGGGADSPGNGGGGGGAGGFRFSASTYCSPSPLKSPTGLAVTAQTYPVTVGAGGIADGEGFNSGSAGQQGNNSVFSTITSAGGGAGGNRNCNQVFPTGPGTRGRDGGSGGGIRACGTGGPAAGSGNTPPVSPPQGNPGGAFIPGTPTTSGAGGGGAGAPGTPTADSGGTNQPGGIGVGVPTSIAVGCAGTPGPCGSLRYFAGGGGGGGGDGSGEGGPSNGGSGGGGAGSTFSPGTGGSGTAGTANTGGGGGGSSSAACPNGAYTTGAAGGKGIVIVRYKFQ